MKVPEEYRIKDGSRLSSDASFGSNGAFLIPKDGRLLLAIASDGMGWDHVSVSLKNRVPSWEEMQFVKNLFWNEEETVMQFHPKKSEYVNNHPYCLHMWKPHDKEIELPPSILTGIK